MFGVSTDQAADFTLYAANGDNAALPNIPRGVVYNSSNQNWLLYNSENIQNGKRFRLNYVIFYNPGSTDD